MQLTVLVNNCVHRPGLKAEHGLSLWLEVENHAYLFDTGASGLVVENARTLGVPLEKASAIILSHGHYDHTGGLLAVLKTIKKKVTIFAHPSIWEKKGHLSEVGIRNIGIPFSKEVLAEAGADFDLFSGPRVIGANMWLTGEIPRKTVFERVESSLVHAEGNSWKPDPILDDQALIIKTQKGLVVITGCAHSGIINTITYSLEYARTDRLYAVIGGFHLWHASKEQLRLTMESIRAFKPSYLITGHCTGLTAAMELKAFFPQQCHFLDVGLKFEL
ncbi:MAG: MBL fold metallo-hydrolase [Candidatus Desulfofervidaceae bacterium]|nr:MBL fold metallo-hydrolase [Candidatus Desulfofervidaceae bacterium]